MKKQELIDLAQKYGWTLGCLELVRGNWAIDLPFEETGKIKLVGPNLEKPCFVDLSELQQADQPWQHLIGPFKQGWFSLKANRFVR